VQQDKSVEVVLTTAIQVMKHTIFITLLKRIGRVVDFPELILRPLASVARSRGLHFFENLEARTSNAPVERGVPGDH
jgi:hypothetical protein